jgi:oxygen-independent coproporphyrinogen-3 oxidase
LPRAGHVSHELNLPNEVSVYIHVPFCEHRCGYCAFVLEPRRHDSAERRRRFVERVCAEARHAAGALPAGTRVRSVYFGGGTPSLLEPQLLEEILDVVRQEFDPVHQFESTIEANPESLNTDYVAALRDLDFTRVSIGLQSTSSRVLRALDRPHTPKAAFRAIDHCLTAGLSVSVDLMGGTPVESAADFERTGSGAALPKGRGDAELGRF